MKRWLVCFGLLVGTTALGVWADAWSTAGTQPAPSTSGATWETQPAGADSPGLIDDYIRDLKWELRRRLEVTMDFGPVSGDSGLLREGSARIFLNTATANVNSIDDADDATDSPGFYVPSTEANTPGLLTTVPPGWGQALGNGMLLADTDGPVTQAVDPTTTTDDDFKLYVFGSSVWNEAKAQHDDQTELSRAKVGAINLVACGDFDCMSATDTTVPTSGAWATFGTVAAFAYGPTFGTEGAGMKFQISSISSDDGAQFTLTGLKNGATYLVSARGHENAADDVCSISTTGAATNLTTQNTSDFNTYETLTGTFVAGASSVVLLLVGDALGGADLCDWDHVGVFEQVTPALASPTPTVKYVQRTTPLDVATFPAFTTVSTLAMVSPASNYGFLVRANYCSGAVTPNSPIARIQEDGVSVFGASAELQTSLSMEYLKTNPTPGTTYTYALQASDSEIAVSSNCFDLTTCSCSLTVELVNL